MPVAWRICKSSYVSTAFDGEGARKFGGRWNSPGTAIVYLGQSRSLAALELLVHLQSSNLLFSYSLISAEFDRDLLEVVDASALPAGWDSYPAPIALQKIGDSWVHEARSAVLGVPSAVMTAEQNYLMNPAHPDFSKIVVGDPEPYQYDQRLKQ